MNIDKYIGSFETLVNSMNDKCNLKAIMSRMQSQNTYTSYSKEALFFSPCFFWRHWKLHGALEEISTQNGPPKMK